MKRLLTAAAALSVLMGPVASLAQEHREEQKEGGHPTAARTPPAPAAHAPSGPPPGGSHAPAGGPPAGGYRPGAVAAQPGYRPPAGPGAGPAFRAPSGPRIAPPPPGARGPRPEAQPFAFGGRNFYRYRAPVYAFPPAYAGWEHHYWRRGEFLPAVFFQPNYFIDDWWVYGLWQPDYGYQWIRVGADALLINLATGAVVDVVPGVYYY